MKIKFEVFGDVAEGGKASLVHLRPVAPVGEGGLYAQTRNEICLAFDEKAAAKLKAGDVVELDVLQVDVK